jgi:sugar lactone lactonase YvrE
LGRTHQAHDAPAAIHVTLRASGFFNASSLTIAPDGRLYFVDTVKQHIYRYTPATKRLEIVSDHPIDAANLFFDKAGDMMIVSYQGKGTVYAAAPASAGVAMQLLKPQPATPRPGMTPVLPIDHWRFDQERSSPVDSTPTPWQYVSPDGTGYLPAGDDFVEGALYYGTKMADVLRAFALRPAAYGSAFYVSDEGHEETYTGRVNQDGSLRGVRVFANRGGEGVTAGPDGRIYLAAGQVYIYTTDGTLTGEIDVPERPTGLIFAGRILYILARTSLYSVDLDAVK